ncbi:YopX family protein [Streptococcus suis]|uniref:YopX family protein n=1 Tax=Streptococcus suis TaxID=1307 RepID=UPI00237D6324|nr:YopX family protein [Streptococcus suis]MDE1695558.1 YopX family protein [Streptococcus suis]
MIPKFRAWDTFDEDMVNDIFFSWQDCGYESLNECLSDERWKFMQSTGKMDSTGQVEVYVGDILYYPEQDEDNYGIIEFDEDKLAFVLDNGDERFIYGDYGMGKVVGNIYQNKDLVDYILGGRK